MLFLIDANGLGLLREQVDDGRAVEPEVAGMRANGEHLEAVFALERREEDEDLGGILAARERRFERI